MKKALSTITMVGVIALSLFSIATFAVSEPPEVEWERTYGGPKQDMADHVVQTSDGGYVLAGYTGSFGSGAFDFWLVKTDGSGNLQWNKTYGGEQSDEARCVVHTTDGGYALAGLTDSLGEGVNDFWLVKTDSDGNMEWNQTYGGGNGEDCHSVVQTSDGGYALAGDTWSLGEGENDFWLVKTDTFGNEEWNRTYGGMNRDAGKTVIETEDGGYAIAGFTESSGSGGRDFWLVKTDVYGKEEWNKTYGGINDDTASSIAKTSDGGYIIVGVTTGTLGGKDAWLIKTDSHGNMRWNQTLGGPGDDLAMSVVQTSDGGYCVAGQARSWPYGDAWLIKLAGVAISARIDIDPDTLNLKSNGQWVTAYIEVPESHHVEDIDISTVMLNNTIPGDLDAPTQVGDYDLDGLPDLMVKFDRAFIIEWLGEIDHSEDTGKSCFVTLAITGKISDTAFEGSDTIKVLRR